MIKQKRKKTKIKSNSSRFRLTIKRSNKNIFLQLIDDNSNSTVISESTLKISNGSNILAAQECAKNFASKAKSKNRSNYF